MACWKADVFEMQVHCIIICRGSLRRIHGHKGAEGLPCRRKLSAGSPLARRASIGVLLVPKIPVKLCKVWAAVQGPFG